MFKNIIILFFTLLLIACSNTDVKPLKQEEKLKLSQQLNLFKAELKNNSDNLSDFFDENLKNKYILERLENIDFSNISIFYTNPVFNEKKASNIIAFSSNGNTFYFEVTYEFFQDKWAIVNIIEKKEGIYER